MKKIDDISAQYMALSISERKHLLSSVLFEISIRTRCFYDQPLEVSVKNFIAFNEVNHRVSSELRSLIKKGETNFDDDSFITILFDSFRNRNLDIEHLLSAFYSSFKLLDKFQSPK